MPLNFADALASVKKKSQLQGVPLPQQVVSGVAAGYSEQASSRLAKIKALELEKERMDTQKSQFQQKLEQDREDRKAAEAASRKSAVGTGVGTVAGAVMGAKVGSVGGPLGAAIGGVLGGLAASCIIITACTSKDSYEVEIAREFRDKYMDIDCLGGYYRIAITVVPYIEKHKLIKKFVKKYLVDRLVDQGEIILGYKDRYEYRSSYLVTNWFLDFCRMVGKRVDVVAQIAPHIG